MAAAPRFGTSLARLVAPEGAPPQAPAAQSAWRRRPTFARPSRPHFGTPPKRFVAPQGAPLKAPIARPAQRCRPRWRAPRTLRGLTRSPTYGSTGTVRTAAPPHAGAPPAPFAAP
eukprot:2767981-Pyramimonas_sp.AAC.1